MGRGPLAVSFWKSCGAFLLAAAATAHASTFLIVPTFDSTITLDPNHAAIESTIDAAIQMFETTFSNPITVDIYFQEGGGLGTSNTLIYSDDYQSFYDQLVANNANPAAIAALNANGGDGDTNGDVNPASGGSTIELKSANARALGYTIDPGCVVTSTGDGDQNGNLPNECALPTSSNTALPHTDGIISLNTSITDPPNSPAGSYYDLLSTTEHEIDEILGLGSALENCDPGVEGTAACVASGTLTAGNDTPFGAGAPEDLFRWSAPTGGTRTMTANCSPYTSIYQPTSAYFAYGPNTGAIAQFNNLCNGADFGDWASGNNPLVQDAFTSAGTTPAYSIAEIDAMTAIGWTTPEPGSMILLAAGLAGLIAYRRRLAA